MKCVIAWMDEAGRVTPDKNEAVGWAYTQIETGRVVEEKGRFPICEKHRKQMKTFPAAWGWQFEPRANAWVWRALGWALRWGGRRWRGETA